MQAFSACLPCQENARENYSLINMSGKFGSSLQCWGRGGARGGLGGYSPPSEGGRRFFRRFLAPKYPENHILAPSSEESAPRRKIPGAIPVLGKCQGSPSFRFARHQVFVLHVFCIEESL